MSLGEQSVLTVRQSFCSILTLICICVCCVCRGGQRDTDIVLTRKEGPTPVNISLIIWQIFAAAITSRKMLGNLFLDYTAEFQTGLFWQSLCSVFFPCYETYRSYLMVSVSLIHHMGISETVCQPTEIINPMHVRMWEVNHLNSLSWTVIYIKILSLGTILWKIQFSALLEISSMEILLMFQNVPPTHKHMQIVHELQKNIFVKKTHLSVCLSIHTSQKKIRMKRYYDLRLNN